MFDSWAPVRRFPTSTEVLPADNNNVPDSGHRGSLGRPSGSGHPSCLSDRLGDHLGGRPSDLAPLLLLPGPGSGRQGWQCGRKLGGGRRRGRPARTGIGCRGTRGGRGLSGSARCRSCWPCRGGRESWPI